MSEREPSGHIPDGPDVAHCGPQRVVGHDRAAPVDLDADLLEAQASPARRTSDRHEEVRGLGRRRFVAEQQPYAAGSGLDGDHSRSGADLHAVGDEGAGDDGRHLGFLRWQHSVERFDQRDGCAESRERLSDLGADRPSAQDRQRARERRQVEQRLVREERHVGEAHDRRDERRGADGDDHPAAGEAGSVDNDTGRPSRSGVGVAGRLAGGDLGGELSQSGDGGLFVRRDLGK
ncbi:MAG TPA: hypothetical protein PKD80_01230 [Microthrixaceae bacterium]|nr:hypothetical protein [Microthrixaceae bacterium]HMT22797.1 hypothetical protein [Microthrixaceae bacterium]HMT59877.1 hypothetical protein [Microthrixaceae bacterium]